MLENTNTEIAKLFELQRKAQYEVAATDHKIRKEKISRIVEYIQANEKKAQDAMYADLKRAGIDTTAELLMVKSEGKFAMKHVKRWMKPYKVKNSMMSMGTNSYYMYEPKGQILVIAPWNAPIAPSYRKYHSST